MEAIEGINRTGRSIDAAFSYEKEQEDERIVLPIQMQLGRLITRSPRLQGLDLPLGNPVSKLMTQLHLRHSASSPFHRRASCVGACHRYHLLVCGTVYRLVIKLDLFVLNNLVDWKKERVVLFFPVQCNLCAENAQFFCLCFIDGKTANGDLSHLYQLEQSNDL